MKKLLICLLIGTFITNINAENSTEFDVDTCAIAEAPVSSRPKSRFGTWLLEYEKKQHRAACNRAKVIMWAALMERGIQVKTFIATYTPDGIPTLTVVTRQSIPEELRRGIAGLAFGGGTAYRKCRLSVDKKRA